MCIRDSLSNSNLVANDKCGQRSYGSIARGVKMNSAENSEQATCSVETDVEKFGDLITLKLSGAANVADHNVDNWHKCPICRQKYRSPAYLQQHMRTHQIAQQCNMFKSHSNLRVEGPEVSEHLVASNLVKDDKCGEKSFGGIVPGIKTNAAANSEQATCSGETDVCLLYTSPSPRD